MTWNWLRESIDSKDYFKDVKYISKVWQSRKLMKDKSINFSTVQNLQLIKAKWKLLRWSWWICQVASPTNQEQRSLEFDFTWNLKNDLFVKIIPFFNRVVNIFSESFRIASPSNRLTLLFKGLAVTKELDIYIITPTPSLICKNYSFL